MNVLGKVLVVDDDPIVCELIQEVLTAAEIEAHALTDSAQAAALLREERFDGAFLDIRMPAPDGIELVRQMRTSGLNQRTLVVMITGEEDRGVLTRAFQAGANFCLFKPVDRQSLLRLVRATEGSIHREKRRFTRVRLRRKVLIESGADRVNGTTLDLSLNGMLVQADHALPIGCHVRVSLELEPGTPSLRGAARVVRLTEEGCLGLQIESLGVPESQRLQEFLLPLILGEIEKP